MTSPRGRLDTCLFAGFLAVLVWAPLPFASNRLWGAMLLTALLAGLCALWSLALLADRTRIAPGNWRYGRWPLLGFALVQLWVLIQVLPLPRELVALLSPLAGQWHIKPGALTLSLDPWHTRDYLLRGVGLVGACLLTLALVDSTNRLRLLLGALVFSGSLQALYGVMMVFSGLELGFFVEKYAGRGAATGTFVNTNHLAGYLVMCLAAGAGLLIAELDKRHSAPGTWREVARRSLHYLLSPRMRLRFLLAVMVVALVMTRSRMGNLAFFVSLAAAGACYLFAGGRFSWRVALFLASLFLVDALILGQWFGFDRVLQRLAEVSPQSEDRMSYFPAVLEYARHFWLTGSGGGSFYGIFPNFQPESVAGYIDHAHNDYLQFAAELGVPVMLMLGAIVLASLWQALLVLRHRRRGILRGAAFCSLMTIVWLMLHSAVDFNLQIPANALTACVLLMLPWICRGLPRGA